jgi:hypothetical protein
MINNIFETKEQFLAFRNNWKKLYSDGFHKPVPIPQIVYNYTTKELDTVGYHMQSPMHVGYHLIHALALGKDVKKVLSKKTNITELLSKLWIVGSNQYSAKFFEPFGDTLTEQQRIKLQAMIRPVLKAFNQ